MRVARFKEYKWQKHELTHDITGERISTGSIVRVISERMNAHEGSENIQYQALYVVYWPGAMGPWLVPITRLQSLRERIEITGYRAQDPWMIGRNLKCLIHTPSPLPWLALALKDKQYQSLASPRGTRRSPAGGEADITEVF